MKLEKISLKQLSKADLNERELCRLWGGGDPGCCQCGCNYAGSGGSSSPTNYGANDDSGYTSDPGAEPCNCDEKDDPKEGMMCDFPPIEPFCGKEDGPCLSFFRPNCP